MKKMLFTVLIAAVFSACGPSKEEQAAREKFIADSVTKTIADQQKREKEIANSISAFNENQDGLKQQLINLKAQLEAEQVKLNDVEKFKLLRTANEKQQQIEGQTKIVETLKQQITDIEKQIAN